MFLSSKVIINNNKNINNNINNNKTVLGEHENDVPNLVSLNGALHEVRET